MCHARSLAANALGRGSLFASGPTRALAEGYVADQRFTAYYDEAAGEGATAFLRDALVAWCAEQ